MSRNFHESFTQDAIAPPSERATGLVFAAIAVIVAIVWRGSPKVLWTSSAVAVALAAASLFAPTMMKPLNRVWFQFGVLLHRIVNPLIMFAIFAVVFVPAGLLMRIWHDPLRSRGARNAATYWIDRDAETNATRSMTNQF
jgi:hypothetical protein